MYSKAGILPYIRKSGNIYYLLRQNQKQNQKWDFFIAKRNSEDMFDPLRTASRAFINETKNTIFTRDKNRIYKLLLNNKHQVITLHTNEGIIYCYMLDLSGLVYSMDALRNIDKVSESENKQAKLSFFSRQELVKIPLNNMLIHVLHKYF